MNINIVFCTIILASSIQTNTEDVTLSINQRVDLLKKKIAEQIKEKQRSQLILPINSEHDEYSYVDIEKNPITPIMDFDERKKKEKFKLRQLLTPVSPKSIEIVDAVPRSVNKKKRIMRKRKEPKPVDSFYRRMFSDEDTPIQWIHCQDLITPFFSGYKRDFSKTKRLTVTDHSVRRFLQLLSLNTTGHTKEEIYSILYQISNLQIRLFQWDVSAITSLLSVVIKDNQPHTMKQLVHGVRTILGNWQLDFGNTTNLLKQARIFRPPCVRVSEYGGSTKTSRGIRYSKPTTAKSTCEVPNAKECET